jgi:hypothetical protein
MISASIKPIPCVPPMMIALDITLASRSSAFES